MFQFKGNEDFAHGYLICRFDQCYLIDPAHDKDAIIEAIGTKKLLGILLTHAHSDHVHLIGQFEVPIFIHLEDAHLLFEDKYNGYNQIKRTYQRKTLDLHYIKDQDIIPIADHQIEVIHTPGHTKGSVTFLFDQKLFTGDTLFKDSVGRHDLYSGSLSELKKSTLKLMSMPAHYKIYPGHDQTSTIREAQKINPFYQKWLKQSQR